MFERLYQESLVEIHALRQRVQELEAQVKKLTTTPLIIGDEEITEIVPPNMPIYPGHHGCNTCGDCTGC